VDAAGHGDRGGIKRRAFDLAIHLITNCLWNRLAVDLTLAGVRTVSAMSAPVRYLL
jgi:hypothetical protein